MVDTVIDFEKLWEKEQENVRECHSLPPPTHTLCLFPDPSQRRKCGPKGNTAIPDNSSHHLPSRHNKALLQRDPYLHISERRE